MRDKFGGLCLLPDDARAFITVCLGIDSTDNAFLRWPKDLGAREARTGDAGREAVSLEDICPTVVAVEDSGGSSQLSLWSHENAGDLIGPRCFA